MSKKKTTRKVTSTKKTTATQSRAKSSVSAKPEVKASLPFDRMNYILLLIGVGIIGFGFILMSMDDFVDATEFSVSLYIAPLIVVAGFLEIIYAIMYKSKSQPETSVD